ncbi:MAG: dephospho-CoA kinase [Bauldia sp.]|nr:dephospho-CoA kinase [Bauldia sp.]
MLILGLTGAIASGKSTTASLFAARGVPVFSADEAVHRLYDGPAVAPIEAAFPGTTRDGTVDRKALSHALKTAAAGEDQEALARLEAIVHPMVREAEAGFIARQKLLGRRLVVLEIPLLFETGADRRVDMILVTVADEEIRRSRALARPFMDTAKLALLDARRLPEDEQRRRAHFVIDTGSGLEAAATAVDGLLRALLPVANAG